MVEDLETIREQGREARKIGKDPWDNPYPFPTWEQIGQQTAYDAWMLGYYERPEQAQP